MRILVTGCAGFIGMHLCLKLLKIHEIIGIDNINSYYDTKLKKNRLKILNKNKKFSFFKIDISNKKKLNYIFKKTKPSIVIHLASEVGVRNSSINPTPYIETNIVGFFNILENCKKLKIKKLLYASSSSVYGSSNKKKFSESFYTDNPISIYSASKKATEILAAAYSYLYNFSIIGLRFFTVYGPFGRPDMAIFKFVDSIYNKKKINIFERGNLERDFTYIDDLIFYIDKLILKKFTKHEVFNIGNSKPVKVIELIKLLEQSIGIKAKLQFSKAPKTEIFRTWSDNSKINKLVFFKNKTSLKKGVKNFINWYKFYKGIKI